MGWRHHARQVIGARRPISLFCSWRASSKVGFLAVVLAIPSMLAQLVTRRSGFVMASGAYMPIGIMLMLLSRRCCRRSAGAASGSQRIATGSCAILLAIHAPRRRHARAGAPFSRRLDHRPSPSCLTPSRSSRIRARSSPSPCAAASAHVAYGVSLGVAGLLSAIVLTLSAITSFVEPPAANACRSGQLAQRSASLRFQALPFMAICFRRKASRSSPRLRSACVLRQAQSCGGPAAAPAPRRAAHHRLVQQASSLVNLPPASLGLWSSTSLAAAPAILAPAALLGSPAHSRSDAFSPPPNSGP